jgi:indolepyruvate decarboxylase
VAISRFPEAPGAGRGFVVRTEEELDKALLAAEKNTDSFSILDVHIDPHDLSPALQRLAQRLGKKVKEAE